MSDYEKDFWNERYSTDEYIYGTEPNDFLKEQLEKLTNAGNLLLPGDGEGRNAVFAAKLGWKVDALDQSSAAMQKALKLAKQNNVRINYQLADLHKLSPRTNYYDAAAVIYVHFSKEHRKVFSKKIIDSLKTGGILILELFSKNQLGKNSGGPQNLDMLYSTDEVKKEFSTLRTIILKEEIIHLNESEKHKGEASVIRFIGEKVKSSS